MWHHLLQEHREPGRLAAAVFVGVFLGVVPLYGIQTALCIGVARLLRLNRLTVVAAAQVSLPMFAPFLLGASVAIGEWIRHGRPRWPADGMDAITWGERVLTGAPDLALSCFVGSLPLGAGLGALGAAIAYFVATRE